VEIWVEHFVAGETGRPVRLVPGRPDSPSISYCENQAANWFMGGKILFDTAAAGARHSGFSLTMLPNACILPTIGVDFGMP